MERFNLAVLGMSTKSRVDIFDVFQTFTANFVSRCVLEFMSSIFDLIPTNLVRKPAEVIRGNTN